MRSSSELASVMRRLLAAVESRDVDTVRALVDPGEETLLVGSDAREWLYGVEGHEVFAAQVVEMPELHFTIHRLDAHEEATIGWTAADTTVDFLNGSTADFRFTGVFRLDDGVWRVVQWHASVPTPQVETGGVELTTSLSELLDQLDSDLEGVLQAQFRTSTVTLLFSDIEESTTRAAELGDAVWNDVVKRHFSELRRVANAQNGIVVKTMGDGAMLAFESARDAARSAVEIQRSVQRQNAPAPLRVRVGVHSGDAMHADGDYLGQAVNKTARIAAAAAGGQVLVSEVVRGLTDQTPGLIFGDPITLQLKGIPGTHTAYPLSAV